jgi:hypothetical protein
MSGTMKLPGFLQFSTSASDWRNEVELLAKGNAATVCLFTGPDPALRERFGGSAECAQEEGRSLSGKTKKRSINLQPEMFPQLSKSHTSLTYRNSFPRDCCSAAAPPMPRKTRFYSNRRGPQAPPIPAAALLVYIYVYAFRCVIN